MGCGRGGEGDMEHLIEIKDMRKIYAAGEEPVNALDGVSLTISALGEDFLGVDLIPTTRKATTLGFRRVGDRVNLEGDVLGKYVAKSSPVQRGLTEAALSAAFG